MIVRENNTNELLSVIDAVRMIPVTFFCDIKCNSSIFRYIALPIFNDFIKVLLHGEFNYSGTRNPYMSDDELEAGI